MTVPIKKRLRLTLYQKKPNNYIIHHNKNHRINDNSDIKKTMNNFAHRFLISLFLLIKAELALRYE